MNNSNNRAGYHAEYYIKNREKIIQKRKEWAKEQRKGRPAEAMLYSAKARAAQKKLAFNIEEKDIDIPRVCPVLGIELVNNEGGLQNNSPSLDRIVPELGYIKGNVQVISTLANRMKSNATPEELLLFAEWVFKTYKDI